MNPDFPLIATTGDELIELADMAAEIWNVSYRDMISGEQIAYMLEQMYAPVRVREEIEVSGVIYHWIAISDCRVGFFAFGPKSGSTGRVWFLHKLYVSPEYQRQGGGQAALEFICKKLDGEGAERLQLRVNRGNFQAIGAYGKYGFERVGECCEDIGGGFVMDDYVMECTVLGDV